MDGVYLSDETLFIGLTREKWMKLYCAQLKKVMKIFSLHLQSQEAGYIALKDGRKLCLEYLDSAIMDTVRYSSVSLSHTLSRNKKVEQHIRKKTYTNIL